jgi:hypothetical protein
VGEKVDAGGSYSNGLAFMWRKCGMLPHPKQTFRLERQRGGLWDFRLRHESACLLCDLHLSQATCVFLNCRGRHSRLSELSSRNESTVHCGQRSDSQTHVSSRCSSTARPSVPQGTFATLIQSQSKTLLTHKNSTAMARHACSIFDILQRI